MPKRLALSTIALITTSLASFLTAFTGSSINIALPTIGHELSIHAVRLSWITFAYILSANVFLLPMGRLADIWGRARIFTLGTLVFAMASLACALSSGAFMLIGFRILQGLGGAMLFGTGVAILSDAFPAEERGRVLGINVAAVYIGLSLGPPLSGLITASLGWRNIFVLSAGVGLVVFWLAFRKLEARKIPAAGGRFDLGGACLWGSALTATVYGFSLLPTVLGLVLVFMGLILFSVFLRGEGRKENPLLDLALFRKNRAFAFSNLAALINYSSTHGVGFLFSLYLQYLKGFTPETAGLIMISQPMVMAVCSPFAGRLSDRTEPRIVASIGMALTVTGLVIALFLRRDSSFLHVIAALVTLGLGFAFFSSPNTNAIMSTVEKKSYGVASALVATMRLSGQTLSMTIVTLVFATIIGRHEITPEFYPAFLRSLRIILAIFSALCLAGVFASMIRGKIRQ